MTSSELCPRGIAVDPSGDYVYVANGPFELDASNVGVIKLSPSLSVLARWGRPGGSAKAGAGTFNQPADLDVDASHAVWVVDAESNLIQYFFYPFGPD